MHTRCQQEHRSHQGQVQHHAQKQKEPEREDRAGFKQDETLKFGLDKQRNEPEGEGEKGTHAQGNMKQLRRLSPHNHLVNCRPRLSPQLGFQVHWTLIITPSIPRKGHFLLQLGVKLLSAALSCVLVATTGVHLWGKKRALQSFVG